MLATDLYQAAYKPVVALWARYAERIAAEYERSLSALTTDAPVDIQALLDEAGSELERLFIILDAALRDWTLRVEAWQRGKWRGAVLSATAVDLQTVIGPEDVRETLESYLTWNTQLVRDVSAQTRQRISNAVFAGLQNRAPAREVAKEIREATGLARDRSLRIASDQLSKLSGALADERRREAGLDVWRWRWSHKKNGRAEHIARDGGLYTDNPALVGKSVGGEVIRAAPERGDRPSQKPYCGCRAQSELIFEFDD
ncbi:hypothetical protein CA235_07415 [Sphingomonas sp. ABOLF]|uniref:phage minor head protein n=1 Tax=Sphingomonas sp. ABOLF TaxID=1985879 RepID=UPI000F7DB17A|nr:phage minor head protein [Sphingomonas sp. ABOLF]RSV15813.1 hypothetical protein CA235_07415 [Sphingomonas sp. ABOLF]